MGKRERQMGFESGIKKSETLKLQYLLFCVPFILAFVSWQWFPLFAEFIIIYGFGYVPALQPARLLWRISVWFLYTWYTFLSIGVGGSFIVAAWIWKRRKIKREKERHPMVSFIIPAYNEEKRVSRCIASLFKCAAQYPGYSEIIAVDDGSTDYAYEAAWAAIKENQGRWPYVAGKVVRHMTNLGMAEAVRTGVNKAMGEVIGVVDADSWWDSSTLSELVNHMNANGKAAVTGYIHPSDGKDERNLYIIFQQQEYSQALGVFRCAQSLKNAVFIVPGPVGLHRADMLREILNQKNMRSVTEDFEITLEMQKRGFGVSYEDQARSSTIAPMSLGKIWNQRLRWFMGGLHNMLSIYRDMLFRKRWVSLLLWYSLIVEYFGAIVEIVAVLGIPLLFWFAPDRTFFLYNMLMFLLFVMVVATIHQAIAIKFAYNHFNHRRLLLYVPLYLALRFINICARFVCLIKYSRGERGSWRKGRAAT